MEKSKKPPGFCPDGFFKIMGFGTRRYRMDGTCCGKVFYCPECRKFLMDQADLYLPGRGALSCRWNSFGAARIKRRPAARVSRVSGIM